MVGSGLASTATESRQPLLDNHSASKASHALDSEEITSAQSAKLRKPDGHDRIAVQPGDALSAAATKASYIQNDGARPPASASIPAIPDALARISPPSPVMEGAPATAKAVAQAASWGAPAAAEPALFAGRPPAAASVPESAELGSSSSSASVSKQSLPAAAAASPPAEPRARRRPRDGPPLLLPPGPNAPLLSLSHEVLDEILTQAQE